MITAALAIVVGLGGATTRVTYANAPADVARVSLYAWADSRVPTRIGVDATRVASDLIVFADAGRRVVLRFEREDGTYLIDGPFWWPAEDTARVLDRRWRRTVAALASEAIPADAPFEWVSAAAGGQGEWPRCFGAAERLWSCWGVPRDEDGVLAGRVGDRIWSAVVGQHGGPAFRSSSWARLLVVSGSDDTSALRVRIARPAPPSSSRIAGIRLETAIVTSARHTVMREGVVWLSGEDVPADAWVEISTAKDGPAFVSLREIADGPVSVSVSVTLEEGRAADGTVAGARDERANAALVTVFRLIDPRPPQTERARQSPRRVFAAETTADRDGVFHLEHLGDAEYEIVAWHPQLGRASIPVPRVPGVLRITLAAAGIVRGRVLIGGKPAPGVDVIGVPTQDAFTSAEDVLDVKGGDARTGADGRFTVTAAAAGGGELRVGGGKAPVRRIPLPRIALPLLDLGDIELGSPLDLTIILDQDPAAMGCDVRAAGPAGQSGLQIVGAARTAPALYKMIVPEPGLWVFQLLCGKEGRPLVPPTMQISAGMAGREVHFSVR
jgi:hypothetical protein